MAAGPPSTPHGKTVEKASANLPQSTAGSIFTITNGRIRLISLVGEVTTIIQTQANATKLTANPTIGTSVDLCATLDITADEVGALYSISGTFGDAMQGVNAGACNDLSKLIIINVGTIDLDCAASNTGAVKWRLEYESLDDIVAVSSA